MGERHEDNPWEMSFFTQVGFGGGVARVGDGQRGPPGLWAIERSFSPG